jgi:hypothetical protein
MNDEVRKALETVELHSADLSRCVGVLHAYPEMRSTEGEFSRAVDELSAASLTIRAELTRLTEIADSVDPLVIRLGEVTTRLEAANAMLREAVEWNWLEDGWPAEMEDLDERITAHLSENGQ